MCIAHCCVRTESHRTVDEVCPRHCGLGGILIPGPPATHILLQQLYIRTHCVKNICIKGTTLKPLFWPVVSYVAMDIRNIRYM